MSKHTESLEIKKQFDQYLTEQKLIGIDQLIQDPKKQPVEKNQKRKWQDEKSAKINKKEYKYAKKDNTNMQYAPKQKRNQEIKYQAKGPTENESSTQTSGTEQMIGEPSLNFIRKIYNIMSHKQEQLEEISQIERKLKEEYNGDLQLAYSQCQSGNWSFLTKDELDSIKTKDQLVQQIEQYQTTFNMYKQFHIKSEKVISPAAPKEQREKQVIEERQADKRSLDSLQLEQIASLMAISQNSPQLTMCLMQAQQAQIIAHGNQNVVDTKLPSMTDIQAITKFFNSMTQMGSYFTEDKDQPTQPTKFMSFNEKIQHIKQELALYLDGDFKGEIQNSIFKSDPASKSTTYQNIRDTVQKCENYKRLFESLMHPTINPALMNQQNFGMAPLQMMMQQQMQMPFQMQQMQMMTQQQQMQLQQTQAPTMPVADAGKETQDQVPSQQTTAGETTAGSIVGEQAYQTPEPQKETKKQIMKDWNEVAEDDVDAMEDRQQIEIYEKQEQQKRDQQFRDEQQQQPQIEDNLSFLKSEIEKNMDQVDLNQQEPIIHQSQVNPAGNEIEYEANQDTYQGSHNEQYQNQGLYYGSGTQKGHSTVIRRGGNRGRGQYYKENRNQYGDRNEGRNNYQDGGNRENRGGYASNRGNYQNYGSRGSYHHRGNRGNNRASYGGGDRDRQYQNNNRGSYYTSRQPEGYNDNPTFENPTQNQEQNFNQNQNYSEPKDEDMQKSGGYHVYQRGNRGGRGGNSDQRTDYKQQNNYDNDNYYQANQGGRGRGGWQQNQNQNAYNQVNQAGLNTNAGGFNPFFRNSTQTSDFDTENEAFYPHYSNNQQDENQTSQ